MILGLLLGNTSLRYGVLDRERIHLSGAVRWRDLAANKGLLADLFRTYAVAEIVAGSVRDDLLPEVMTCLPPGSPPVSLARRDFPLPIENRYEHPEEAGTDRLLNALAAGERAGGRGGVVVDFGTAVSLTVVSPDGAFLGGLIAAGSAAVIAGLKEVAPCLPAIGGLAPAAFLQRNAREALRSGLYWEIAGGVGAMLHGLVAELGLHDPLIVATGGDAPLFAPGVASIQEVVPDLTLEGLRIASRGRS
jgi:type III pantothenate kinase